MYNPYESWQRYFVENLSEIEPVFEQDNPEIGGGDSETSGLHIIKDKPFLIIFGWLVPNESFGRVVCFNPTPENMKIFFRLAKKLKKFVWWNTKFDLHMMANIEWEYDGDNLVEGMAVARLSVEAIPARDGGDSLELKEIGKKYVHPNAADSEKIIKTELNRLNAERIKVLSAALKAYPVDPEYHQWWLEHKDIKEEVEITEEDGTVNRCMVKKYPDLKRPKFWGKGLIEDFLKDPTHDVEDLPEGVQQVWVDWLKEYPEPTYADVPRDKMIRYAGDDVITMLEYVAKALPTVETREQMSVLDRESRLIKPLYRMERAGIKVDRNYLLQSKERMKAYIKERRTLLCELAGEELTVGQHARIIQLYQEKWGITLESADKKALKDVEKTHSGEPKEFASLIRELRTLEKWYSTYLLRLLRISEYDGRYYTQINQCSAVSGRVGADSQQNPKEMIKDKNGNELFCPRRAYVPTGNGYNRIWYLDYDQVELKVQANYTILVSGGDLNLCRAYMPFKCKDKDGNEFDFKAPENRKLWNLKDYWFTEDGKPWIQTDVHAETTHNALVLLGYECYEKYKSYEFKGTGQPFFARVIDEKEFKKIRSKGKIFNFMKNYGGGLKAAMEQLDLPQKVAQALIDGFTQAFPHVVVYQDAVSRKHRKQGYVHNMYGRRYYLKDTRKSYKLGNYNVQGSCADFIKEAIIEIDDFIQKNNLKSRMILTVHDENDIEEWEGEEWAIHEIRKIMEKCSWSYVPITAGMEVTTTNWFEKKEVM